LESEPDLSSRSRWHRARPSRLGLRAAFLLGLAAACAGPAAADPFEDCNNADKAAVRIAGCTLIIEAAPSPEVLAIALMNRGIGFVSANDLEAALSDFDAALETSPGMTAGLYNRGNVNLDLRNYEAAIRDFSAVIAAEPAFALAWLNRGLAREQAGDKSGARSDFERALQIDKALAPARRGLARLKARR
jgi:tetratricopeptide (TPR) repeat protein